MNQWDDKLVERMRRGEEQAFEQCYQALSGIVYGAILRICRHAQTAQDLLHDSFIDAFENIQGFDQHSSFVAWLKRIAFNNTYNYLKRQRLGIELLDQDAPEPIGSEGPEQLIGDQNLLGKLLETLAPTHRLILWMFIVEQYSHEEIGKMMDKSPSYSKSIVSRALQKLKQSTELENHIHAH